MQVCRMLTKPISQVHVFQKSSLWSTVCCCLALSCGLSQTIACPETFNCDKGEEYSYLELTIAGQAKDLICHVDEDCKVTWEKEGRPLISSDVNSSSEARCNGRQLFFPAVQLKDDGNYTCFPEDCGSCSPRQDYHLRVDPEMKNRPAISTQYTLCKDQRAPPGGNVTFCCVFEVGRGRPSETIAYWTKGSRDNCSATINQRDEEAESAASYDRETQVVACISIVNVTRTDYDNFTVCCNNGIGGTSKYAVQLKEEIPPELVNPGWFEPVLGVIAAVVIATILAIILYKANRIEIQLILKDKFGKPEQDDGKLYDAYLSYYWSDSESQVNMDRRYAIDLNNRLSRLGYNVYFGERDFLPGSVTSEEISQALTKSRRYIMLLSPEFLTYRYMNLETDQYLDIADHHKRHIIPLFIGDIKEDVIKANTVLDHIVSTHPHLDWRILGSDPSQFENNSCRNLTRRERRVWKTLLLQMPPVPAGSKSTPGESNEEIIGLVENQEDLSSRPAVV